MRPNLSLIMKNDEWKLDLSVLGQDNSNYLMEHDFDKKEWYLGDVNDSTTMMRLGTGISMRIAIWIPCKHMSFMDGFSVYNQIKMYPKDEKHTSFRTSLGVYYYTIM